MRLKSYPHFDVIITDDYMSRPVVNEIVKDIVIYNILPLFFGGGGVLYLRGVYIRGGLELEGVFYYKRQPKQVVFY